MTHPLSLSMIWNDPDWTGVIRAYEQYSQYERLETLFERPWGIHGVHHAWRVLFHTLVLCRLCRIDEADRNLLVSASLFHDIGRENDGRCYRHGKLSVEKMKLLNLFPADPESAERLNFIISYHCIEDDECRSALQRLDCVDPDKTWRLFGIFKDADGLDRVRIGDLDARYLRNMESLRMERLASELFAKI